MNLNTKQRALAIGGVAAIAAVYFLSHGGKEKEKSTPPVTISTAAVTKRDMPLEIREVGSVVPYQSVAVRSRLDSLITEVRFRDGDYVKEGDVLFVLDDRALKAQLGELQANVLRDKAQLENLRVKYERTRSLNKQGFAAAQQLDTDRAAYEAQKATIHASEASLENVRVQLGYSRILAPISGRTGTISVTVGNNVKANDAALVTINQLKPIRVQTSLSQKYLDSVRSAMQGGGVNVTALREGVGEAGRGTVDYIDNRVEPTTGSFEVRARFANEDEKLWPGMFVNLLLQLGAEAGALTVPEVAVQHGQDSDYVFVIQESKAAKRPVTVARIQNGQAIISDGVKEGEQIAIDGLASLKDGSNVKFQGEDKEKKEKTPDAT